MSEIIERTFTTKMPDKPGAFMLACKVIMEHGGNITRVSFNRGINLFIDVAATREQLKDIDKELSEISYVDFTPKDPTILVMNVRIKDVPGALYPVLKVINKYDVNISYLNSKADNGGVQNFHIGMEVENPTVSKKILDEVAEIYALDVVNYNGNYDELDCTVQYIRLANTVQKLFSLEDEKVIEFIGEARKVSQILRDRGQDPAEVFENVKQLANFIAFHRDLNFKARITQHQLTEETVLHVIEPPVGSNTYVIRNGDDLLIIDTGMGIFSDEMITELREMFPAFFSMNKRIIATHADVDHCGLLSEIEDTDILVSRRTADLLEDIMSSAVESDDPNAFSYCYGRLGRIISDYNPPEKDRLRILGKDVPEHDDLRKIDTVRIGDIELEIYEGPGGHLSGETVCICREPKLLFTGDIYTNAKDMTPDRGEFNEIAPFFLTNVDADPEKLKEVRSQLGKIMDSVGRKGMIVCGGHGNIKKL